MDKTLILSERHCSVLELNEVIIGLSGKGGGVGGSGSCLAFMRKVLREYSSFDIFFSTKTKYQWGDGLESHP